MQQPLPKKKKQDELDDDDDEDTKNQSPVAVQVVTIIDGIFVSALMTVITIVLLWGDDFKDLYFSKDSDFLMDYLNVAALVACLIEFFGNAICKDGYKWGFFFWLDMIAALTIVPDVRLAKYVISVLLQMAAVEDRATQAQGAGDTERTARSGRLARLVRLVRLIRIVKLYSMVLKAKDSSEEEQRKAQARAAQNAKQAALRRVEASRLGKVLSEMTTRRVLLGMLLMLLVLPLLSHAEADNSRSFGLKLLFNFGVAAACTSETNGTTPSTLLSDTGALALAAGGGSQYQDSFFELPRPAADDYAPFCTDDQPWVSIEYWEAHVYLYSRLWMHSAARTNPPRYEPLLYLSIPDPRRGGNIRPIEYVQSLYGNWSTPDSRCTGHHLSDTCPLRSSEITEVFYIPWDCMPENPNSHACEGVQGFARFDSKLVNQLRARNACIRTLFVCLVLCVLATQFQQDTQLLVIAPVEKMVSIIKQLAVEPLKKPEPTVADEDEFEHSKKKAKGPQLETAMLESTITKIGGLLQLGFGASGADVLGANMSSGDGELNIMMPGSRVYSIFAYVDIRDSATIAEAMEEDVLAYVNLIADIVQTCVIRWGGVPLKTLGDSFVLLWRSDRNFQDFDRSKALNTGGLGCINADKALLSLLKIFCEIRRSEGILNFLQKPVPRNLKLDVEMGFSLHAGWAIEGPIGSDYKVDAAYLSSDVTLTHFIENTTKMYGVTFMLSQNIYMMFSLNAKDKCRLIDMVKIGETQINLYTFDIGHNFELEIPPEGHQVGQLVRPEDFTDIDVDTLAQEAAAHLFAMDRDVALLQAKIPEKLTIDYRQGLSHMASGEWAEAKSTFEEILQYCDDGPTKAQLKMMAIDPEPESWPGYHVLDNDLITMLSSVKELRPLVGHGASPESSEFLNRIQKRSKDRFSNSM
jgi:class 3 adenylate cyclase